MNRTPLSATYMCTYLHRRMTGKDREFFKALQSEGRTVSWLTRDAHGTRELVGPLAFGNQLKTNAAGTFVQLHRSMCAG